MLHRGSSVYVKYSRYYTNSCIGLVTFTWIPWSIDLATLQKCETYTKMISWVPLSIVVLLCSLNPVQKSPNWFEYIPTPKCVYWCGNVLWFELIVEKGITKVCINLKHFLCYFIFLLGASPFWKHQIASHSDHGLWFGNTFCIGYLYQGFSARWAYLRDMSSLRYLYRRTELVKALMFLWYSWWYDNSKGNYA